MQDQQKGGWQASEMECDKCAYRWVAVHPAAAEYLQCEICNHMNPAPFPPETEL